MENNLGVNCPKCNNHYSLFNCPVGVTEVNCNCGHSFDIIIEKQGIITQLVGYCKSTANTTHLFFRAGDAFFWCSTISFMAGLEELKNKPGVKVFPQEPHIELYAAKTWEEAKKWFENP